MCQSELFIFTDQSPGQFDNEITCPDLRHPDCALHRKNY